MRALITRPRLEAEATARALALRGIDSLIAPVIAIEPIAGALAAGDLAGAQALLITSANAARALAEQTQRRNLRVLAVGQASAAAARQAGFNRIDCADGDVAALAELAVRSLDPGGGKLLHLSGQDVAGDLAGRLAKAGFAIERRTLYRARAATVLPHIAAEALTQRNLDLALFFSPRSAGIFVNLVIAAGLAASCAFLTAFALSPAVDEIVAKLPWRRRVAAAHPDQDSLMAAIDNWKKGSVRA